MAMWIDTHAHPLHARFNEEPADDIGGYLEAAKAVGVERVLGVACRRSEWTPMLEAAQNHEALRVIAGVHPHDADEDVTAAELDDLARNPLVVALGETGFDFYYTDIATPAVQEASFRQHMEAAQRHGLPIVVHTRDAEVETLAVLRDYPKVKFVLHCFTGSRGMAEAAWGMGGYISFSGILTFGKSAAELSDIAKAAPRDKVLIETDAPYLAPAPHRGKRNASMYVPHTAAYLAELWQIEQVKLAEQLRSNTLALFARLK
jgi:TatD DNase family protein